MENVINFIVVDDNRKMANIVENVITRTMMSNPTEYRIHCFDDYDKKFMDFIKQPLPNKVYILDIETKSASGIDVARFIRKNDMDSILIFITAHDELGSTVVKEQFMILTFICKFDDFENKIQSAIMKSLQILGKKTVIRFQDCGSIYTIPVDNILYVTRDSVERRVLIKTDYTTYKVNKTISEIKEMAHGNLKQSHRACLVNKSRIGRIDKKRGVIIFDNGDTINLLSDIYKKELV